MNGVFFLDQMVLASQKWVNKTYGYHPQFDKIVENGKTGWSTVYALTKGLQIELGITTLSDSFGPTTLARVGQIDVTKNSNIVKIIQAGLYCKGYPGGDNLSGVYTSSTLSGLQQMQLDMGLDTTIVNEGIFPKVFKALLTMDAYVVIGNGTENVRQVQRWLNRKYINRQNFFFMPCDGNYSRDVQKYLIYAIQYEIGMSDSVANGNFGPGTQTGLKNVHLGLGDRDTTKSFVHLFQAALRFNNYEVAFDGVFSSTLETRVKEFQNFAKLSVTGKSDFQTWASLLVSTGDVNRKGTACDCVTQITDDRAKSLKAAGYETVGRYLTNVPNSTLNKKIQPGELENIFNAGLTVFPIYQTVGSNLGYFSREQGEKDADAAYYAAREYGFLKGTTIYFAVDFDVLGYQITENIIPYFAGVNDRMKYLGNLYNIGVYGPRAVCIQVSNRNLAITSFVSGMSTGYSGNLGYPLPNNWAFDQISIIKVGSGVGQIEIDNNIKSGRYKGESRVDPTVVYPVGPDESNNNFLNQIDNIYDIALEYTGQDIPFANELLCHYLRHKNYSGALWAGTAGPLDEDFIDLVNERLDNPELFDFFDLKYHIALDIPHFAATLNSVLFGNKNIDNVIVDLAGWAGDLITVAGNAVSYEEYSSTYNAAVDLIGNKHKGTFSLPDLLGDIDANNIANMLINIPQPLNELLRYYLLDRYKVRFSLFFESRFENDLNTVLSESKYILNSKDPIIFGLREVFISNFNVVPYTEEQGDEVARAFRDVLKKLVESE